MEWNGDLLTEAEYEWYRMFNKYMKQVDTDILNIVGMVSDDLPDYDYATAYSQGISAHHTAESAIANAQIAYGEKWIF